MLYDQHIAALMSLLPIFACFGPLLLKILEFAPLADVDLLAFVSGLFHHLMKT